jgi:hypothetical protein
MQRSNTKPRRIAPFMEISLLVGAGLQWRTRWVHPQNREGYRVPETTRWVSGVDPLGGLRAEPGPVTSSARAQRMIDSRSSRNSFRSGALIPYAGSEQTRTAPSPPPGRCRSHAQQSAPLISLLPMTARSFAPYCGYRCRDESAVRAGGAGMGDCRIRIWSALCRVGRALDGAAVDTVRRSS